MSDSYQWVKFPPKALKAHTFPTVFGGVFALFGLEPLSPSHTIANLSEIPQQHDK
jgi:hypothetical protein